MLAFDDSRLLGLLFEKAQHSCLQLWMQMSLRLLYEKKRQVGIADFLQLYGYRRHVKQIGITMPGIAQILGCNSVIGKLETQVTGDIDKFLVIRKAERRHLSTHSSG